MANFIDEYLLKFGIFKNFMKIYKNKNIQKVERTQWIFFKLRIMETIWQFYKAVMFTLRSTQFVSPSV